LNIWLLAGRGCTIWGELELPTPVFCQESSTFSKLEWTTHIKNLSRARYNVYLLNDTIEKLFSMLYALVKSIQSTKIATDWSALENGGASEKTQHL
jgi:hypothetical protein